MITQIYIEGQRLDLFDDESININSSIADVSDIEKVTTEYSKEFTVPASSINNRLFKHYYDFNINNTFDARVKVNGNIQLGGVPFRFGKFRLLKVNLKKNKPESYTINFVGNLVDIKKELGKDELSSLDLSEYDHSFDGATIKQGLQSSLFGGDIIYTLNPNKQYFYNSDANDTTNTERLVNIASNGGSGVYGASFTDLAPSIKAIRIIEAIEDRYDLTFSRDFFGTNTFNTLYQTLRRDKDSISGDTQEVDFDGGDTTNVSLVSNIGSFFTQATSASNDNITWILKLRVVPSSGFENTPYTLITYVNGQEFSSENSVGNTVFETFLSVNGQETFDVRYEVSSSQQFSYTASLTQLRFSTETGDPPVESFVTTASENTIDSIFITSKNITKIRILDWLKGMFKAFKLVIIPQEDGTFYVDTLNRYYSTGNVYEVTRYIKSDSHDVERGELFNEIVFNFEEPSTILNEQFSINNGIAYGDAEVRLEDENGEPLDGDSYEIDVPFETVVYDRLIDVNTNITTNVMYAPFIDLELASTVPKTNLFYNVPRDLDGFPIRYITDNNAIEEIGGYINTASHTNVPNGNSGDAFLFSPEFNEWDGSQQTSNLYTNYHKRYIDGIFSIKRRNFKHKAIFPLHLITTLKLNDVLKIKGNFFRIDNFETNLITQETTLKLINAFGDDLNDLLDSSDTVFFNSTQDETTVRTNINSPNFDLIDLGYGTDWVTVTQEGFNLNAVADPNDTGFPRSLMIGVLDATKKREDKEVLIFQLGNEADQIITFDNTNNTFDSVVITFDNG